MNAILEMRGISKNFPGVKALRDVNLVVKEGEIHAICGENGAGKSTLMKVLSGVYPYGSYEGQIIFQGEERRFDRIADSEHLGVIIIHQELALVPLLSIAENIFLGNETANAMGVIDWGEAFNRTRELLAKVGLKESPNALITNLGIGKQQLVEIAKALAKKVKLLILDEPTASLNESDSDALLNLLIEFKGQGITSIIISHKLNELAKVADSITVIRDGATVETIDCHVEKISEGRIIKSMVGREMSDRYPPRVSKIGEKLFEIKNWRVEHPQHAGRVVIKGVDLHVGRGEVVGVAGLMGAGRTELAMSVFGRAYGRNVQGQAFMDDKEVDVSTIQKAVAAGIAYVTEDRKSLGLVLSEDIKNNVTLANLPGIAWRGVIDNHRERKIAQQYRQMLKIRSSGIYQKTVNLSGGNQQKVVLSKWLFAQPKVLILDEPTRGIDVGAKYEIYGIVNDLAAAGKGVIVISSEMPELLGICDRIYVMNEGRFVDEMPAKDATQEKIMASIMKQYGVAA
jgi:putative multiple sugar transport system ATP-binding protein